jgi:hypothetical protein
VSEDAPELTAELVVDGVVPSQPVISPDGCWVAYVVAPAARQRVECARFLPELVTSARLNGHTWHDIAQALATSPDEARLRFDPDSPVADGRWPYGT